MSEAPQTGGSATSRLWRGALASPKHRRLPRRRRIAEVAALLDRLGDAVGGDAGFLVGAGLGVDGGGVDDLLELGPEAGADVGALAAEPLRYPIYRCGKT